MSEIPEERSLALRRDAGDGPTFGAIVAVVQIVEDLFARALRSISDRARFLLYERYRLPPEVLGGHIPCSISFPSKPARDRALSRAREEFRVQLLVEIREAKRQRPADAPICDGIVRFLDLGGGVGELLEAFVALRAKLSQ